MQQVLVPSKEAAKGYLSSRPNIYFAAANMADIISSCEVIKYSCYVTVKHGVKLRPPPAGLTDNIGKGSRSNNDTRSMTVTHTVSASCFPQHKKRVISCR